MDLDDAIFLHFDCAAGTEEDNLTAFLLLTSFHVIACCFPLTVIRNSNKKQMDIHTTAFLSEPLFSSLHSSSLTVPYW